jgi:O-methyltransferase
MPAVRLSGFRLKKSALDLLENLGFRPRDLKKAFVQRYLVPRGYGEWQPLIFDEQDFKDAVGRAVDKLLGLQPATELGDYLEFGVSRGTSMACVYHVLQAKGLGDVRLVGFDSFKGLPPEAADEGWEPGIYSSTAAATRRYLRERGVDLDRVTLVKGWFRDSLNEATKRRLRLRKASLIMVDCDIYAATREVLAFVLPLVQERAVIIFDDWGWRSDIDEIGQREAFQECIESVQEFEVERLDGYIPQSRIFLLQRRTKAVRSVGSISEDAAIIESDPRPRQVS